MNRKARRSAKHNPEYPISLDEALTLAMRLHQDGILGDAERLYRGILQAVPSHADASHFLGVLLHQIGRSEEAISHIERAIANSPSYADAHNNLGNVYKETGDFSKAAQAYRTALELVPNHTGALNNLGVVLTHLGEFGEAVIVLQKAIELAPSHADYFHNLGNTYRKQGDYQKAAEAFRHSIALQPYQSDAYRSLWRILYAAGEFEKAGELLREWLERDPANPIAQHNYAAFVGGGQVPERASDSYVQHTFDSFAGSFDQVLARLQYRAPQLVADAVGKVSPGRDLVVLDAGCGTGLCGPLLRPYAGRLLGVDLSPNMLAKAVGRQVYEDLVEAELVDYLRRNPSAFDLIVSADTLVYFGELRPFADASHAALRPGGHLVFTLEKAFSERDYTLNPHGRYSHSQAYAEAVLGAAGLEVCALDEAVLRNESDRPVLGMVITAARKA